MTDYYELEDHPWGTKPTHLIRQTKDILKPGTVLDLGGGDGKNSLYLAREGFTVTNVDSHPKALRTFKKFARQEKLNVNTVESDLEKFHIDQNYDNIISTFLLHHLSRKNGARMINEMMRFTSDEGLNVIIAFTENGAYPRRFPENFYVQEKELLRIYNDWEILRYFKMMGGTIDREAQERVGIVARKV
jgi:tellurite methyltransferase